MRAPSLAPQVPRLEINRFGAVLLAHLAAGRQLRRGAKENQDGERAFHGVETPVYWLVPMHDLAIRNALLPDGAGSSPRHGDLAVRDGRIAEIGEVTDSAKETIDAGGLALMPGIIDNHTHYDAQLTWDPSASPSPALGVTTAINGNCGLTIAPCRPADRDLVMRHPTQGEGMSPAVRRTVYGWEVEPVPRPPDVA